MGRKIIGPVKSAVLTIWICRHMVYHIFIGLVYAWILREIWGALSIKLIFWAVVGSLILDLDHFLYYFVYGRNESYAREMQAFLSKGKIRSWVTHADKNHKQITSLWSHNIYVTGFLVLLSGFSFLKDLETGTIFFGAMALHLLFDILDDLLILGALNPNWKRWGWKK